MIASAPTLEAPLTQALPFADVARAWRRHMKEACACVASVHWRAVSFRETEGQPMTLRRARALNAVLDQCALTHFAGDLLVGVGLLGLRLPEGAIDPAVIEADRAYVDGEIGRRTFGTHCDHHAPDYRKLLRVGFGGLRAEAVASAATQDAKGRLFLESMVVALDGASAHMRRWADRLDQLAAQPGPFGELLAEQAAMMNRLATEPARTFHEAVQLVLSYHHMMQLDDRHAMAFGRLDQFLQPYLQADLDEGLTTREAAQDVLDHFFARITVDGDVQNIALGGVRPEDGADATNDVSYMILEACRRVGQPGGNCTARIHQHTPPAFLEKCAQVIATGIGYPAVFNDDVELPALLEQGYPLEHARDYCFVGCIEVFLQGRQAPWADGRTNAPHALNLALFRGVDSLTGEQVSIDTGEPATFDAFYDAFITHIRTALDRQIQGLNAVQQAVEDRAEDFTSPLMSATVDACIARGRDVNDGGALYGANFGLAGMGVASVADTLCAIKKLVYDTKRFTLDDLRAMIRADFEGYEKQRQILLRAAPKYGNDIAEVDDVAVRFVEDFGRMFKPYRTPQGGFYWLLLGSNVSNIWAGQQVGATADGRHARTPISDAASAFYGRDIHGPTAAIRSFAKLPYHLAPGGNVVNVKLHPSSLKGEQGVKALACLIRTCFDLGGSELQFNTTDRNVLLDAMEHPERHENLVVRVSGFSYNFTWLSREVQEDILARTEHTV